MTYSPVVELRQYTLKPGARATLVEIFEEHFIESQEALGISIGGLFLDLEDPDRFVWMRGFPSMEERKEALETFYFGSAAWKEHGPAANETMIDSDDVLLLRPTDPPRRSGMTGRGDVHLTVWLHEPGAGTCDLLTRALTPDVAAWRTEPAENTFPALPVRPDHAFVAMTTGTVSPAVIDDDLRGRDVTRQTLRLRPTARSRHA